MATPLVRLPQRSLQIFGEPNQSPYNKSEYGSIVCSLKSVGTAKQTVKAYKDILNGKIGAAAERGVKKATKYLLNKTLEVTPVDTGNLRESGQTYFIGTGFKTKGIVYFDESIAPYAIFVHEDLTKYHEPPTMAKFLQRTQWKERANLTRIIEEECAKGV